MQNNNFPDFLIIGAAKAGTTSLHNYLTSHSSLALSQPKEPKFLSYQSGIRKFEGPGDSSVYSGIIKSLADYNNLFYEETHNVRKGESSADSLYYFQSVIPVIKNIIGDPSIIILLRNPVERAFSAYTHLRRDNRETLSFEDALAVEQDRIEKGYEFIWHYKNVGRYAEQVNAYIDNFSKIKIFLFEDLKDNPQKVTNDTCNFIGVSPVKINAAKVYNKSGIPKENWQTKTFSRFFKSENHVKNILKPLIPKHLRQNIRSKAKEQLFDKNLVKPKMNPETRKMLIEYFREDILNLQTLINRDLSNWLK